MPIYEYLCECGHKQTDNLPRAKPLKSLQCVVCVPGTAYHTVSTASVPPDGRYSFNDKVA